MNALKSTIDVSSLQKGIYLMRASIENKKQHLELLKNNKLLCLKKASSLEGFFILSIFQTTIIFDHKVV